MLLKQEDNLCLKWQGLREGPELDLQLLSQTKDAKDHEPSGVKALKHATCFKIIGEQF